MTWIKLDDQFFVHPKVVDLSKDAKLLYLAGVAYCGAQLTDGRLSAGAVRIVAATVDADRGAVAELVQVGLWEAGPDGYQVHDYLDYQPSRERALSTREARAEAGHKGGVSTRANKMQAKPQANAEQIAGQSTEYRVQSTDLDVDPPLTPPVTVGADAPERVDNFTPFFEAFWTTYPPRNGKKLDKAKARERLKRLPSRDWDDLLTATANYARSDLARRDRARDPCRFLAEDYWRDWLTPDEPTKETAHDQHLSPPGHGSRADRNAHNLAAVARLVGADPAPTSDYGAPDRRSPEPPGGYPRPRLLNGASDRVG